MLWLDKALSILDSSLQAFGKDAVTKDTEELFRDAEREGVKDVEEFAKMLRAGDLTAAHGLLFSQPRVQGISLAKLRRGISGTVEIPRQDFLKIFATARRAQIEVKKREALQISKPI